MVSHMSGWPSGLRRQTQEILLFQSMEHSGPLMWAGVRIPLLTYFYEISYQTNPKVMLHSTLPPGHILQMFKSDAEKMEY